jgi:hypothetical protein
VRPSRNLRSDQFLIWVNDLLSGTALAYHNLTIYMEVSFLLYNTSSERNAPIGWNVILMSSSRDNVAQIARLQRDLATLCGRLDKAPDRTEDAASSLKITALSREVERLCREAAHSDRPHEIDAALATVQQHLKALQDLLPPAGEGRE